MELSDQTKKDFEQWYVQWIVEERPDYSKYSTEHILMKFYREVDTFKWGVYLRFFDSVGVEITILPVFGEKCNYDSFRRHGYTFEVVLYKECQYLGWEMYNMRYEEIVEGIETYGKENSPVKPIFNDRMEVMAAAIKDADNLYIKNYKQ